MAEALLDVHEVAGLRLAAPAQLAAQQRLGAHQHQGRERADHPPIVTACQASQTASTLGAGEANTLRWRA